MSLIVGYSISLISRSTLNYLLIHLVRVGDSFIFKIDNDTLNRQCEQVFLIYFDMIGQSVWRS